MNFGVGATIANSVVSDVAADGTVCLYVNQLTHVVVDVGGFLPRGSDYRSVASARLLDSRLQSPIAIAEEMSWILLNQQRSAAGRSPLVLDEALSASARAWSQEMARSGFRHSGRSEAESIGRSGSAGMPPQPAAARIHTAWVDSPPHFQNMVSPAWTSVGVGIHHDATGWYITHVFR